MRCVSLLGSSVTSAFTGHPPSVIYGWVSCQQFFVFSVISVISVKTENFVGLVIPFGTVLQIIYENTEYSKGSVTIFGIVIRTGCNKNGHVSVGKGKLCPTKPVYLSLSSSGCTGKP